MRWSDGPAATTRLLAEFCDDSHHRFWPDNVSLLDVALFQREELMTHSQIIDLYLLGLAVRNRGKLATFDQGIPVAAVAGGEQAMEHLST